MINIGLFPGDVIFSPAIVSLLHEVRVVASEGAYLLGRRDVGRHILVIRMHGVSAAELGELGLVMHLGCHRLLPLRGHELVVAIFDGLS